MSKIGDAFINDLIGDVNRAADRNDAARQAVTMYQDLIKSIAASGWAGVADSEEWRHLGYAMDDLRAELVR